MDDKTPEQKHAEAEAAAATANQGSGTATSGSGDMSAKIAGDNAATTAKLSDAEANHIAGRSKDAPVIEDRGTVATGNEVDRTAQIARADEAMKRKTDDSSPGAQKLAKAQEDEEAAYANHADLPPTSGKAFDMNTPKLDDNGNKHWGVGV